MGLYVSALVTELLLLWGVTAGLDPKSNGGWRAVLGSGFFDRRGIPADLALASLFQGVWIAIAVALASLAGKPAVSGVLPKGAADISVWILLSLGAGICEEFAFRGYFLRQFLAFSRNPAIALAAQALLFGAIHSYQGPSGVLTTAAYGAMMGLLTLWRGNLRAAMAAHALTDLMAVLWAR